MDISNFDEAFKWVMQHGYFLMLIAMIIEGPIITAAASFAVAFGTFSLPVIFLLSILGDLIGDVIFYAIGYFGRIHLIERIAPRLGLSLKKIHVLEDHLHNHAGKTMAAIKLNPITPLPGLMLVGALRMSLRRYIIITLLIIIPKTILFMILGYYFGEFYDTFANKLGNAPVAIGIIAILGVVIFILFRKYSVRISNFFMKD